MGIIISVMESLYKYEQEALQSLTIQAQRRMDSDIQNSNQSMMYTNININSFRQIIIYHEIIL